jgi:hypothetical protein
MDKQTLDNHMSYVKNKYDKNYTGFSMHPEEGMETKLNDELINIQNDLIQIDNALIAAGTQVYNLMTKTLLRLDNIHTSIMTEKERFQDMQMLCNKYNDYDQVKLLKESDFQGKFNYENGVFSPPVSNEKSVKLHVIDVFGNGYEGNKYVYKDYAYTNKTLDTSIRTNITDSKVTSYYEYSRVTVSNTEENIISDFNKDNKEAVCTITFHAEEPVNEINIRSDNSDILIINVAYTLDGLTYTDLSLPYLSINNKLDSYENYGYVYGSGKIVFPEKVPMFKITFQSNGYNNDEIAYEKTLLVYEDYYDETGYVMDPDPIEVFTQITTPVESAKRHVIKLNEIDAGFYQYENKSKMQTYELINQDTYAIAVFANVYIPSGLTDDSVKFTLTINGIDYEVVPINSHLNGTKIVRFSTGNSSNVYTQRIGEKIKSAYLTISFSNETKLAPRVNNVKILLGGEL